VAPSTHILKLVQPKTPIVAFFFIKKDGLCRHLVIWVGKNIQEVLVNRILAEGLAIRGFAHPSGLIR
jgi:hypothetical protein